MQFEESQRIPFEPWQPAARRVLVFAPHPDDEVIGCGGLIALLRAAGAMVRVVVATDGAEGGTPHEALPSRREEETVHGLALLGVSDARFLRLPDRSLTGRLNELKALISGEIEALTPDMIVIPSLVEIHPDHAAVAMSVVAAIQQDAELPSRLPMAEVAFYEVSQPFAPNRLLDITAHVETKRAAISTHKSQIDTLPYDDYAAGLNRYRSMTLGPRCAAAEGYWVAPLQRISATPAAELARAMSPAPAVSVERTGDPVSVIVRTLNRPEWLREAVDSALASTWPVHVIVVNDGGRTPDLPDDTRVSLIDSEERVGRSEAMNRGVESARTELICFLDDDDLYAPDHVETLVLPMREGTRAAFYTDAVNITCERDARGEWTETSRERRYASDYDPDLLAVDNYIPLPTLIVRRDDYLALGGFDRNVDLFEDWDFLLRLQRRGTFERIPRVTCTIRHFAGSGSIIRAAESDRATIAEGKQRIWARHGAPSPAQFAVVLERMKGRTRALEDSIILARGSEQHARRDVDRLEHDKESLIRRLGEQTHRADVAEHRAGDLEERLEAQVAESERLTRDIHTLIEVKDELQGHVDRMSRDAEKLWGEIHRLNSLLDSIYASRTWKLHSMIERVKGRG